MPSTLSGMALATVGARQRFHGKNRRLAPHRSLVLGRKQMAWALAPGFFAGLETLHLGLTPCGLATFMSCEVHPSRAGSGWCPRNGGGCKGNEHGKTTPLRS